MIAAIMMRVLGALAMLSVPRDVTIDTLRLADERGQAAICDDYDREWMRAHLAGECWWDGAIEDGECTDEESARLQAWFFACHPEATRD